MSRYEETIRGFEVIRKGLEKGQVNDSRVSQNIMSQALIEIAVSLAIIADSMLPKMEDKTEEETEKTQEAT